jgi:hypothetical protein
MYSEASVLMKLTQKIVSYDKKGGQRDGEGILPACEVRVAAMPRHSNNALTKLKLKTTKQR